MFSQFMDLNKLKLYRRITKTNFLNIKWIIQKGLELILYKKNKAKKYWYEETVNF